MSWPRIGTLDAFIAACLEHGGYRVTDSGHVVKVNFRSMGVDRRIAEVANSNGYMQCNMQLGKKRATAMVHRVVCISKHGMPSPPQLEVNHRNGIKTDNRPDNLEWVSVSGNVSHAHQMGLRALAGTIGLSGAMHHAAKLSESQVKEVFELRAAGMRQKDIGERFGISQSHVSSILRGESWRGRSS